MGKAQGYPQVTYRGALDMQVCVPKGWDDMQVITFAEEQNPCGTSAGWHIRNEGHPLLAGDQERVDCSHYFGYCHIMLDA